MKKLNDGSILLTPVEAEQYFLLEKQNKALTNVFKNKFGITDAELENALRIKSEHVSDKTSFKTTSPLKGGVAE